MIRLHAVSVVFNKGIATELTALKEVSLRIGPGEYAVVIGSNGSGKSTLLNCIAGNQLTAKGSVYIADQDVSRLMDFERSRYISRIFQNPLHGTAPDLTVIENFRIAALRSKPKLMKVGIDKSFTDVVKERVAVLKMGLEDKLSRSMGSFSGGQRQALTLAMAVMDETSVLLLDEPTAALDPKSSVILMESADRIIRTFNLTAILVTHHLKDACRYGNRLIQLQEGAVIRDYTAEQKNKVALQEMHSWFD